MLPGSPWRVNGPPSGCGSSSNLEPPHPKRRPVLNPIIRPTDAWIAPFGYATLYVHSARQPSATSTIPDSQVSEPLVENPIESTCTVPSSSITNAPSSEGAVPETTLIFRMASELVVGFHWAVESSSNTPAIDQQDPGHVRMHRPLVEEVTRRARMGVRCKYTPCGSHTTIQIYTCLYLQ